MTKLSCTIHLDVSLVVSHDQTFSTDGKVSDLHETAKKEIVAMLRNELGRSNLNCSITNVGPAKILVKEHK